MESLKFPRNTLQDFLSSFEEEPKNFINCLKNISNSLQESAGKVLADDDNYNIMITVKAKNFLEISEDINRAIDISQLYYNGDMYDGNEF